MSQTKKGVILDRRAREIVISVDKYFENEKNQVSSLHKQLQMADVLSGLDDNIKVPRELFAQMLLYINNAFKVTERTSAATGIHKNTISRIRCENRFAEATSSETIVPQRHKRQGKRYVIENYELIALHNIINSMYTRKEVPTLKNVFTAAQNDTNYPGGISSVKKIIFGTFGYRSKLNQLKLRPDIRACRIGYLRRIRENDALGACKKPVVYVDETWIHTQHTAKELWHASFIKKSHVTKEKESRWILTHAGGEDGFVDGALMLFKSKGKKNDDIHGQMNIKNLTAWLKEQLIPNLPENAIIVVVNTFYKSMIDTKPPVRMSSGIPDMQAWLKDNKIDFSENLTKPELYEIIKKNNRPTNYVENILTAHGFEVLRLPPPNCDLNPMEYIWHSMKQKVAEYNVQKLESQIEGLARGVIASTSKEEWVEAIKHVKTIEQQYWERDMQDEDKAATSSLNAGDGTDKSDSEESDADANNSSMSDVEEME